MYSYFLCYTVYVKCIRVSKFFEVRCRLNVKPLIKKRRRVDYTRTPPTLTIYYNMLLRNFRKRIGI